jgi:hypothetical protein
MTKRTLSFYSGLMKEAIANDKDKMALYSSIDMHRTGQWQTPEALKALPWIRERKFASTKPADALDSGARTFATMMPRISITPLSDHPQEYGRVESLETALDWHFKRMNMNGTKTTHWRILESAMRYCAVAMQTEYLPHTMRGQEKDARTKAILRQSKFQWTVHHPSSVHSRRSKNILEMAGLAVVRSAAELIEEFGSENEGIIEMISKIRRGKEPTAQELMTTYYSYYDVTDWEYRCQWIVPNNTSTQVNPEPAKGIELRLEEHKLPFIPWVIVDNEDPILKNVINTGLLDNLNILRTIEFSKAVASAAESKTNIETPDGTLDGVTIDNTNPTQPMVTRPGVRVQELRGTPIDPQISNMRQTAEGEVNASSVTQVLSDANALDSRNFSTANIKYRTAVAQLSLARDCASRAEELGFYQMFEWIDFAKDKPLVAFRDKSKTFQGSELAAGQEIVISNAEDLDAIGFDLEHLYIQVEMQEDSLMDEQSKWNLGVTQVDRFGMSREVVAEKLGVENYGLHEQKRAAEELVLAQVQAEAKKIMAEADAYAAQVVGQVQMQLQQAQMQMQQEQAAQMQQQQQPQNAVQDMNAGGSFAGMQGADMRGGGMPAMQMAPGQGREQMNGMDMTGAPLA